MQKCQSKHSSLLQLKQTDRAITVKKATDKLNYNLIYNLSKFLRRCLVVNVLFEFRFLGDFYLLMLVRLLQLLK